MQVVVRFLTSRGLSKAGETKQRKDNILHERETARVHAFKKVVVVVASVRSITAKLKLKQNKTNKNNSSKRVQRLCVFKVK